ncbi:phage tail protein [Aquincola tertiaricarbonis]|uniref:Phage tail protein n=1 Tax=Aquincola tertiaricarbonis TaxID=391953 RepID=A0ABY4SC22_AQUTE|nr:host specificity factor TipJ family phage tail protein [Aquincola tertiaricarbonis]URI08774.1 phage tail protein [Aquincola tertiaricarbonis]
MLTVLTDPAGITGRQRYPWDFGASLHENIARHIPAGADCELRINGLPVDPLTDPRLDLPPNPSDFVMVLRRPEGFDPITWAYIAIAAVAVASYALMPKIPGSTTSKDSPNNSLTGQSNVARAYQAIPDVYGYRRCWPDLIQPSTVEYIDHLKYVSEWLCVSRGVGDITEVQYAETPIGDIDGASYEVFEPAPGPGYPELRQTTISDVIETFASEEVNGQELPYAEPFADVTATGSFSAATGATSFTVVIPDSPALDDLKSLVPSGTARVLFSYGSGPTEFDEACGVLSAVVAAGSCTLTLSSSAWVSDTAASGIEFSLRPNGSSKTTLGPFTLPLASDRIRWNTIFLRGLKGSVDVRAEWWQIDGAGDEISGTRQTRADTYSADTYDSRYWTTEVTPTAGYGRYRVQFTRLSGQVNSGGADVAKLEELYAVRHYATKVLPGVTVIRVTTKATNEATGYSDRKFNLRWQRRVRRLDDDALSASRNFARAMAHVWTIAGNPISGLDVAAFAAINQQLGEDSPLLRFDGSLDDADMSLGERLQTIANTARCVVWRDGLRWTMTRDQARPYPELQLDYRNLAPGGESAVSYAAHLPASNDGVEVEYVDEAEQSKKAYIRLSISTGAPVEGVVENPLKVKLPGCTTQAQALNRARLEARRLLYQRTSMQDTALADAGALGLGSLIRWIDPNDFGGDEGQLQAGEVLAIAGDVITTSEPLDWKGQPSGRVLFTGADGRHLGAPVLCYPSGPNVRLATVPAGLYVAGGDRQLGSRYAFAVGLTPDELEAAGLFTVTELKPTSNGSVSIACAEYDERIYQDDE